MIYITKKKKAPVVLGWKDGQRHSNGKTMD